MVKPAAPWFVWGFSLWGACVVVAWTPLAVAASALGLAGSAALAVGVVRLVQHADRAAGVQPYEPAPISDDERRRQAAARAALLREVESQRPGGDVG